MNMTLIDQLLPRPRIPYFLMEKAPPPDMQI